jgi:hypothetical protein
MYASIITSGLSLCKMQVANRRKVSLGTQQVHLTPFRSHASSSSSSSNGGAEDVEMADGDGGGGAVSASSSETHVFAASDRPAVIYGSAGTSKLHFSNVNMTDINLVGDG